MPPVTIRDAKSEDIADILDVTERSWNAAYSDILSQETIDTTMGALRDDDITHRLIEREDIAYFVAERDDAIAGYISGAPSDEEGVAVLGALYVDPDYWNDGTGTELLRKFEEFCRHRGEEWIQFSVLAGNEVGLSFYRNHGYTEVDERETDRFGEPVTERVFRGSIERENL